MAGGHFLEEYYIVDGEKSLNSFLVSISERDKHDPENYEDVLNLVKHRLSRCSLIIKSVRDISGLNSVQLNAKEVSDIILTIRPFLVALWHYEMKISSGKESEWRRITTKNIKVIKTLLKFPSQVENPTNNIEPLLDNLVRKLVPMLRFHLSQYLLSKECEVYALKNFEGIWKGGKGKFSSDHTLYLSLETASWLRKNEGKTGFFGFEHIKAPKKYILDINAFLKKMEFDTQSQKVA